MNHHNTPLIRTQDRVISRTILGFLTAPLVLLAMAGTLLAL
jgi:hypothetical protein